MNRTGPCVRGGQGSQSSDRARVRGAGRQAQRYWWIAVGQPRKVGSPLITCRVTIDPAFSIAPVPRRLFGSFVEHLSLIHISEPTRLGMISYAVFCLTK